MHIKISAALLLGLPQLALAMSIGTQVSQERFTSEDRAPWRATEVFIDAKTSGPVSKWGGLVSSDSRYGAHATGLQAYAVREIAHTTAVEGRLFLSGGADYLVKQGAELTLYSGLPAGIEMASSISRKLYATDSTTLVRVALDREFQAWRVGGGVSHDLTKSTNVIFVGAKYTTPLWSTGLRLAKGEESERSESGYVVLSKVRVAVVEGTYSLQPQTKVRLSISRTLTTASRAGVSLGLAHSF